MIAPPELEVSVYDVDLRRALWHFYRKTKKSWTEILRSQGRLLAVNLAIQTQPYGMNNETTSRLLGERRVGIDIGRVFKAPFKERHLDNDGNIIRSPRLRARLDELAQKDPDKMLEVYAKVVHNPKFALVPDPAFHKAQRNRHGRVRRRPATMIVESGALAKYVKQKQRLVGFVKSGWATVARQLGGVRGIRRWVLRNAGPGSIRDNTAREDNPSLGLTNEVRYASDALPRDEFDKAVQIQADKMDDAIAHALRYEARAAGFKSS